MGFLDDLSLLGRHAPEDARNLLKTILGGMPITQIARGEADVSPNKLAEILRGMPVFDAQQGAQDAYAAGLMGAGTLKPEGGFKSAKELVDAFEKKRGIDAYVSEGRYGGEPGLTLSQVVVPKAERGKGIGSEFMEDLVGYADQTGQRVFLTPATDFGATSVNRLKRFYKRFGFVENKGRNKDFTTRETMYRREGGEK